MFHEESKKDGVEHSFRFTDPYESVQQPIDKAWAHTKNYAADVCDRKKPSMLHQLVQCTEMRVPQDTFSIRTDCPIFPILFSLPSSFRTNSSRRTVFLAVCLEVSDVQESLRPVPAVSSARSANKQVPAACVMRKPILEDYLFYKELRQVLPERVDEILADEAVRSLSLCLCQQPSS